MDTVTDYKFWTKANEQSWIFDSDINIPTRGNILWGAL